MHLVARSDAFVSQAERERALLYGERRVLELIATGVGWRDVLEAIPRLAASPGGVTRDKGLNARGFLVRAGRPRQAGHREQRGAAGPRMDIDAA